MPFSRLTLQGAFARLQSEREGFAGLGAWLLRLGLVAGLVGCAGIGVDSSPEAKQKVVSQRAEARWQLLMKGDLVGAYEYLSSGSKAAMPLDVYKAKVRTGMWRKASVDKVQCEGELCSVQMLVTYDAKQMKGIETPMKETWIIERGSAWYVYR